MDLILSAIPFLLLLILLELGYGYMRGRNTYRLNDTINSLSMGSLSRLQALVILGASASIYEFVVVELQLTQLSEQSTWVWISALVLYDFAYYWKHRWGHEVALFWGAHVAHHQSEDFNLGTALRQTSMDFYGFLFYLPFFLLGYPSEVLFTVVSLNLIYQFWVHTEHIPKLGPIEWVFVTPSNHRVHHGRNALYVDRNYGGVFIIWDRIFGTFQDELEAEPVSFGLRKPLNSWNPLWANVHVYWRLILDCIAVPGLKNKLLLSLRAPGWRAQNQSTSCRQKRLQADLRAKFNPRISTFSRYYTLIQFFATVGLSLYVLINAAAWAYLDCLVAVCFLAFTYFVHGCWLEGRRFGVLLEGSRLLLASAIGLYFVADTNAQLFALAYLMISIASLFVGRADLGREVTRGETVGSGAA